MGAECSILHGTYPLCIVCVMPTGTDLQPDAFDDALMQVVRMKMARLNLNIADLSRMTDISRPTMSRIINGKRVASLAQIRRIAVAIEMPMASLWTASENLMAGKDPF